MQINESTFVSELVSAFKENGMGSLINPEKSKKFYLLTERMLSENEKYNLTAITEPDKIILNHYLDCAVLCDRISKGATVIDIGCGAGFPSLPLAIIRDDIKITAVDSTAKRTEYVKKSAEILGLNNLTTLTMRAEEGACKEEFREKYDFAVARAVAELRVLTELCLGYVKVGGKMIAMKGKNAEYELNGAKRAISIMGGSDTVSESITLKGKTDTVSHPLIIIQKGKRTPKDYPRVYAKISKKPL